MYQQLPNSPLTGQPAQCIKRLSDNAFIPFDDANTDFAEYKKWLAEGNVPLAVDALVPQENGDTFTLSL
jgi:hypothetical protein